MYKNLDRYFEACQNCGACCAIPGVFLPYQIDLLGHHLKLDREQLFRTFLIAELFTPHVESTPVFVISPVKTDAAGKRMPDLLSDRKYALVRRKQCIFRDSASSSCRVHDHKPFGCTLLICGKMTNAKPIFLNKTYYYHQWMDSQDILFSIFPELGTLYGKLLDVLSRLPARGDARTSALLQGNAIINKEMAFLMNGRSAEDSAFYRCDAERASR